MSQFNLEVTLAKAVEDFAALDPLAAARRVEVRYAEAEGMFAVRYFNREVHIRFPEAQFMETDLPITEKILILHYLTTASGQPLSGEWISFKELPGGEIYNGPFFNRAVRPFLALFGDAPRRFEEVAQRCGAKRAGLGDVSFIFNAFPRVPITIVLWEGDEEFPASANILFDGAAADYLATEDYAIVSSLLVSKLKGLQL